MDYTSLHQLLLLGGTPRGSGLSLVAEVKEICSRGLVERAGVEWCRRCTGWRWWGGARLVLVCLVWLVGGGVSAVVREGAEQNSAISRVDEYADTEGKVGSKKKLPWRGGGVDR